MRTWSSTSTRPDTDGDGIGNEPDPDDVDDAFPLDAAESVDTDDDGTGNNADTDDDGVNDGAEIQQASDPRDASSVDPRPGRLRNIATRGFVGTGDDVLIGGLSIEGPYADQCDAAGACAEHDRRGPDPRGQGA